MSDEWTRFEDEKEENQTALKATSDTVTSTGSILSDTGDCLSERGDKISQLADSSEVLVHLGNEYKSMARQLKEKQKQQLKLWSFKKQLSVKFKQA